MSQIPPRTGGTRDVAAGALASAVDVGLRASREGYEFPDVASVRKKLEEELAELDEALEGSAKAAVEAELGDALFTLVNLARKAGVDPEAGLRGAVERFEWRYAHAERAARARGLRLRDLDDEERDQLWNEAKEAERTR